MEVIDTQESIAAKLLGSVIEKVIVSEELDKRTYVEILEVIFKVIISEEAEVKSISEFLDQVTSCIATRATFGQIEGDISKNVLPLPESIVTGCLQEVILSNSGCLHEEGSGESCSLVGDSVDVRGDEAGILLDSSTIPGWNDEDLLEFVKDYSPEQLVTNFGDSFLFTDDVLSCNNLVEVTPNRSAATQFESVSNFDSDNHQLQSESDMSDSSYSLRIRELPSEKVKKQKRMKTEAEIAEEREAEAQRMRIREANRKLITFDITEDYPGNKNNVGAICSRKKVVTRTLGAGFSSYTSENTERFKNSRVQKPTFLFTFPPLPPPTYDKFMARQAEIQRFEEAFSDRKFFEILLQNEKGELVSFKRVSGSIVEEGGASENNSDAEVVKPVIPKAESVPRTTRGFGFRPRRVLPDRSIQERKLPSEYKPSEKQKCLSLTKHSVDVKLKPSRNSLLKPIGLQAGSTVAPPSTRKKPLKPYLIKKDVLPSHVFSTSQKRKLDPESISTEETKPKEVKLLNKFTATQTMLPSKTRNGPMPLKSLEKELSPSKPVPEDISFPPPDVPKKIKLSYRDLTPAQILEIIQFTKTK